MIGGRMTVLPSGVLQIYGVEKSDAGSYRCTATNIGSRRRSSEATLTVTPGVCPTAPVWSVCAVCLKRPFLLL